MLLLPNASCCKSITCGKLQNKHLEALGNSTDFMLLGLGDRHLPSQLAAATTTSYLYLTSSSTSTASTSTVPCSMTSASASKNSPADFFWFSRIPGASTLILQRQEAYLEPWWPALFRIGRKFLNGQKILKKQQSWKKIVGGNHPPKMPPSFSVTNPSDFRSGTFSHPFTYFWTEKCLSFKQIRKSQPREIRLKNRFKKFKTLPHFFSNAIPRKSIPPTRNSHVHGIHCFT